VEGEHNDRAGETRHGRVVSYTGKFGSRCVRLMRPSSKPLRLTISVEKIDYYLADIQKQVEDLQREMTNLRLVRTQWNRA